MKERAQRPSETQSKKTAKNPEAILLEIVHKEITELKQNPHLKELGRAFGTRVLSEYGPVLRKLEGEVFGQEKLSRELRHGLRTAVALMYRRRTAGHLEFGPAKIYQQFFPLRPVFPLFTKSHKIARVIGRKPQDIAISEPQVMAPPRFLFTLR